MDLTIVTNWSRALKAARRTQGKDDNHKSPSRSWVAKMLLAEHSPIRLVEYEWIWPSIKQWVTAHLVRHFLGVEKFVHSQREDRRELSVPRDELPQGAENDMMMTANAQALINISRKRLCSCASPETRAKWQEVKDALWEKDPIMASRMVPECQYRGFCPEFMKNNCGYFLSDGYVKQRLDYCSRCEDQEWVPIFKGEYMLSSNGVILTAGQHSDKVLGAKGYVFFRESPVTYSYIDGDIFFRIENIEYNLRRMMVIYFKKELPRDIERYAKNRNIFDMSLDNISD